MKTVVKLLTALAAIAGTVYVIATYGDKLVAWAKKLLASCPCHCECTEEDIAVEEAPVEEAAAEEAPAEEAPAEEVSVEEAPVVEENAPVAEEADFEA